MSYLFVDDCDFTTCFLYPYQVHFLEQTAIKSKPRVKIKAVCTGWTRMEEAIPTHSRLIVI